MSWPWLLGVMAPLSYDTQSIVGVAGIVSLYPMSGYVSPSTRSASCSLRGRSLFLLIPVLLCFQPSEIVCTHLKRLGKADHGTCIDILCCLTVDAGNPP